MKKQLKTTTVSGKAKQRQATLTFEKGTYLKNQSVEVYFEEIRQVISDEPAPGGYYFQIGDKKTIGTKSYILIKIKNVGIIKKKEFESDLAAIVSDLKAIPYWTKASLTEKLGERKGQYIVDPKFMFEEMTTNPELRFKTYIKGVKTGEWEIPKSSHDAQETGSKNSTIGQNTSTHLNTQQVRVKRASETEEGD